MDFDTTNNILKVIYEISGLIVFALASYYLFGFIKQKDVWSGSKEGTSAEILKKIFGYNLTLLLLPLVILALNFAVYLIALFTRRGCGGYGYFGLGNIGSVCPSLVDALPFLFFVVSLAFLGNRILGQMRLVIRGSDNLQSLRVWYLIDVVGLIGIIIVTFVVYIFLPLAQGRADIPIINTLFPMIY